MKFSYHWLKTFFTEELPAPKKLAELLTFHSFEVESVAPEGDDWVFDIDILPNRRHDCLSHRGIAREISVLTGAPLARDPFVGILPEWNTPKEIIAEVEDTDGCPRYIAALIRGVYVKESPDWLKNRLRAIGQKSINNIVDAANYVMFDFGQPLHAFDADIFEIKNGAAHIAVRSAKDREAITALGGEEYELKKGDLVIADGVSGAPLGIAGIKGGIAAEISEKTKNIIIESANFNPARVRATAGRLGLRTDASLRFESGLAPEQAAYALNEVAMLIEKLTGAELLGVHDIGSWQKTRAPIPLSAEKVNKLLGTSMDSGALKSVLAALQFGHTISGEGFLVTPPFERLDVETKEDLIEEVGRVHGYEKIKALQLSRTDKSPFVNKTFYYTEKIRDILVELGFSEVYTHAIGNGGDIELENPLAEDKKFLRKTLVDTLNESLGRSITNIELLGIEKIKIFEIGKIFYQGKEQLILGLIAQDPRDGDRQTRIGAEVSATIHEIEKILGADGITDGGWSYTGDKSKEKVAYQLCFLEKYFEKLPEPPKEYELNQKPEIEPRYHTISSYPFVLRDIAVFVPEDTKNDIVLTLIKKEAGNLLHNIRLFDEFRKDGKVSYAFRLVFQSHEKTLSDEEVNEIMERITSDLNAREGFAVR